MDVFRIIYINTITLIKLFFPSFSFYLLNKCITVTIQVTCSMYTKINCWKKLHQFSTVLLLNILQTSVQSTSTQVMIKSMLCSLHKHRTAKKNITQKCPTLYKLLPSNIHVCCFPVFYAWLFTVQEDSELNHCARILYAQTQCRFLCLTRYLLCWSAQSQTSTKSYKNIKTGRNWIQTMDWDGTGWERNCTG